MARSFNSSSSSGHCWTRATTYSPHYHGCGGGLSRRPIIGGGPSSPPDTERRRPIAGHHRSARPVHSADVLRRSRPPTAVCYPVCLLVCFMVSFAKAAMAETVADRERKVHA